MTFSKHTYSHKSVCKDRIAFKDRRKSFIYIFIIFLYGVPFIVVQVIVIERDTMK